MIEALDLTDRKIIKPEDTSVAIIIRSATRSPDGSVIETGHDELRDYIISKTQNITPLDKRRAGKVAGILERIWKMPHLAAQSRQFEAHRGSGYPRATLTKLLTEREKKAIELRRGGDGQDSQKYVDIGRQLGVTANGAYQITRKAMARARYLEQRGDMDKQAAYDAVTINHFDEKNLMRNVDGVGPKTVSDLGAFLLAELNPELVLNSQAATEQLTLDI